MIVSVDALSERRIAQMRQHVQGKQVAPHMRTFIQIALIRGPSKTARNSSNQTHTAHIWALNRKCCFTCNQTLSPSSEPPASPDLHPRHLSLSLGKETDRKYPNSFQYDHLRTLGQVCLNASKLSPRQPRRRASSLGYCVVPKHSGYHCIIVIS